MKVTGTLRVTEVEVRDSEILEAACKIVASKVKVSVEDWVDEKGRLCCEARFGPSGKTEVIGPATPEQKAALSLIAKLRKYIYV